MFCIQSANVLSSVFLKTRSLLHTLRKKCTLNMPHAQIRYIVVCCKLIINTHEYTLNKMPLKETYAVKLYIGQMTKML